MLIALTRAVPPSIVRCELTHLARSHMDVGLAAVQHARYEAALETLGCTIQRLPDEPELPDSVFVEDTAVVVDEVAVIARPGAESRRAETDSVAEALRHHRPLRAIEPPGTLDGGDVLRIGRRVYVGLSARTNADGATQLRDLLVPFGYAVHRVEARGCLHLKTAVTAVAGDLILLNPSWVDADVFEAPRLEVHPDEPFAANTLRVGETVLCSAAAPRTLERLESHGLSTQAVDVSELEKGEAGLTCCSVIVPVQRL